MHPVGHHRHTVLAPDLATDHRWPRSCERAAQLGARSMLSFQLHVEGDDLGALDLYARQAGAFDERSVAVGELFAAHAAVARSAAQREAAMERALASRELVGQAQGILIECRRLMAEQAFTALARASQDRTVELAEVARRLVESGDLPVAC